MIDDEDEAASERVVLGGLWAILNAADVVTDVALDGEHGRALRFELSFMKSPYRLTVERITDDQPPG